MHQSKYGSKKSQRGPGLFKVNGRLLEDPNKLKSAKGQIDTKMQQMDHTYNLRKAKYFWLAQGDIKSQQPKKDSSKKLFFSRIFLCLSPAPCFSAIPLPHSFKVYHCHSLSVCISTFNLFCLTILVFVSFCLCSFSSFFNLFIFQLSLTNLCLLCQS